MAGRRSDHDNVNPGQFSAPNDENTADAHLHDAAKMKVAGTKAAEREELIPRRGENPVLADLRARRDAERSAERAHHEDAQQAGAQHAGGQHADHDGARAIDAERTE